MSWMRTIDGRWSHDHLDLRQPQLQILECTKETWLAWGGNMDHDRWVRLTTLSSLASAELPEIIIWVVDYNQGKRSLEIGWHQVDRKSQVVGQGSGNNHGHDQHTHYVLVETSLADSRNRM